ncbi:hypothetical protein [Arthrobacter sp. H-02-3]|uniref:hypothetical protein n=1 Tax=Arthrobacter sp. H-02-3 TaxID=2703675 RepID=UPI00137AE9AB|nr:hypothetical protein [Arthrobacter sp. H-02-3]
MGLEQTFYLGTVTNAFEIDRTGNTCILAGAVVGLVAVGWSRYRGDALWVTIWVGPRP